MAASNTNKPNDDPVSYAKSQVARVGSFPQDPLHSAAYLKPLVNYLEEPSRRRSRLAGALEPPPARPRAFLQRYKLASTSRPQPSSFSNADDFLRVIRAEPSQKQNELLLMCGQPSPQWLNAIGSEYGLDPRFLFRHLEFLSDSQRDWYTSTILPSRAQGILQLWIPSIVFVGASRRFIEYEAMREWRRQCRQHIRDQFKAISLCRKVDVGRSIVRSVNLHSADCMVIEQKISIVLLARQGGWSIVVWSDAGDDHDTQYLPLPKEAEHLPIAFCPVFFEKELQGRSQPPPSRTDEESLVQPLSALATSYGRSLNWEFARQRPIQVIEEFFNFSAAASAQYIDMLDKHISEALGKVKLAESDSTGLDLISTFDDAQNSLVRYAAHFQETIQWVRKASSSTAWLGILGTIPPTVNVPAHIPMEEDLQFLTEKARTLVSLCESGKSTLLSNTSIEESRRSNEEARLVNNLSKATTRLTFIFLPISYVTSIFGMNFRQFGQGEQDISLWFMITIPLLFFCVAAVEFGPFFWRKLRAMGRSILNAILG